MPSGLGRLPSEMVTERAWCTREDPFAKAWEEVEALLASTPELEAKTIFGVLMEKYPGRYEPGAAPHAATAREVVAGGSTP